MLIEEIFPQVVCAKSTLRPCLLQEGANAQLLPAQIDEILNEVPSALLASECFLDRMTDLWRYEFGLPYNVNSNQSLFWGTHMWVPVKHLWAAISFAHRRLPASQRVAYLRKLAADPGRHQDTLCEMAPVVRIEAALPARFEIAGMGVGNKTVDWVLGPVKGRTVLFDVKRRTIDFIKQADHIAADNRLPDGQLLPPDHDPALLFRSVEGKFLAADPDKCLQGVWIQTDIKQERTAFTKAFEALDGAKVHFAILGDWEQDVHIVVSREQDRPFLLKLFFSIESDRFTFNLPKDLEK